jgi:hypothetical protein
MVMKDEAGSVGVTMRLDGQPEAADPPGHPRRSRDRRLVLPDGVYYVVSDSPAEVPIVAPTLESPP